MDLLYRNCYQCSVLQKIPKEAIRNETKTIVNSPHSHFHADIIKRANQNILLLVDHFSTFQDAMFIESEKASDLKDGLISLSSTMRKPGEIFISVDNSPGFKTLLANNDNDLKKLNIIIVKTDELNKNSNAVVDKQCQELETEIKKLEPEGGKIGLSTLKLAVMNLNSKLRRRGTISSFEINFARDQNTGENMKIDDKALRGDQLEKRKETREIEPTKSIDIGDTVKLRNKNDKHKASEIFIVTSKHEENVELQKLLHPLKTSPPKIMSKIYKTNQKHLAAIHKPAIPEENFEEEEEIDDNIFIEEKSHSWNPINRHFYEDDESDDDTESHERTVNDEEIDPSSSDDLQWDSTPEQYALQQQQLSSSDDQELQEALQPRRLFEGDDDNDIEGLTSTSDEEVFARESFQTPPSTPKLRRRNAMRKKPNSEPRVTRNMLKSNRYQSISNPASPSDIILDRAQNLENILNPRIPIVADVVTLGPEVQRFEQVLEQEQSVATRRSSRQKPRVDYKQLNNYGRK